MFSLSFHNLPVINSYEAALTFYERAHPVRCSADRYFGRKYDRSKIVYKSGNEVRFRYHRTDIVRWQRPDQIVIEFYNSRSTCELVHLLTPHGISCSMQGGQMRVNGYLPRGSVVTFQRKASGEWKPSPVTVQQETRYVLDKARAAQIRKIFAPFLQWKEATEKLRGEPFAYSWSSKDVAARLLRAQIERGYVAKELFFSLATALPGGINTLAAAYTAGGAIVKEDVPLGQLPKPSTKLMVPDFSFHI